MSAPFDSQQIQWAIDRAVRTIAFEIEMGFSRVANALHRIEHRLTSPDAPMPSDLMIGKEIDDAIAKESEQK